MKKVKIQFLQDYTVKDDSGMEYTAGDTVTLEPASARHFINRGVAVEFDKSVPVKALAADEKGEPETEAEAKDEKK